ncbi:MAG: hypothetical protein ATN35_09640 [Epulopiscium sp. Nele67-Bin004]|nr:MAG: hypothetical protein ATN35_09640 [Epulopiscium sp. Nele67-Bin004]
MSIKKILETYDDMQLQEVARQYEIRGYYKLNRNELIVKLLQNICYTAEQIFCALKIDYLTWWYNCSFGIIYEWDLEEDYFPLLNYFLVASDENKRLFIPVEIKNVYEKIYRTSQFENTRKLVDSIRIYRDGLLNLYGAVELYWFREMHSKEWGKKISIAECYKWLGILRSLYGGCKIIQDFIVHESLYCITEADFYTLKMATRGMDYYEPTPQEVLLYSNELYYVESVYISKLRTYLEENYNIPDENIEVALSTLIVMNRALQFKGDILIEEILKRFSLSGIEIVSQTQFDELAPLVGGVIKSMRAWRCKGHVDMQFNAEVLKLGRNDECPCGSGKKYKKCCIR